MGEDDNDSDENKYDTMTTKGGHQMGKASYKQEEHSVW